MEGSLPPNAELAYKFFKEAPSEELCGVDRLWPTPSSSSWGADTIMLAPDVFFSARPTDQALTSAMERARAVLDQRSMMSYGDSNNGNARNNIQHATWNVTRD
jgi:hypothetical protein